MRTLITFLVIAGVAATNLRGTDETPESRELQTYFIGGRGNTRGRGKTLFIVEDDDESRTIRCADDIEREFRRDFDDVEIVTDDDDARDGDVVAVIDRATNCDSIIDDIERELGDYNTGSTVYIYYDGGRRYYRNRNRNRSRGYRLWGRNRWRSRGGGGKRSYRYRHRSRRSDKKDKDDGHHHGGRKWWGHKDKDGGHHDGDGHRGRDGDGHRGGWGDGRGGDNDGRGRGGNEDEGGGE